MLQESVDNLSSRLSNIAGQVGRYDLVESLKESATVSHVRGAAIAFIGEFGRGKTTLINALLGIDLLPSGGLPMQQSFVKVSVGQQLLVDAHFVDGTKSTIEATNEALAAIEQSNAPRLDYFEIEAPIESLPLGVTLLKSPGLGDINPAHRQVTEQLLAQSTDVVFLLDASVALSEMESLFLKGLPKHIRNLLIVVNKIDLINVPEQDIVTNFVSEQLATLELRLTPKIYKLSARNALNDRSAQHPVKSSNGDWLLFLEDISALVSEPTEVKEGTSSIHQLRFVIDSLQGSVDVAKAKQNTSPLELEPNIDDEHLKRQREELERSRKQIESVIDDQIADMMDVITDSFDAKAYTLKNDLKTSVLLPSDADRLLQEWLSQEETRARSRLVRLFQNVLEEIHHATDQSVELTPNLSPVHARLTTSTYRTAEIPNRLKTISIVGGGVAATLATRYFLLLEGGLGFVASVSVGGLVALAIWTVLTKPSPATVPGRSLDEIRSVILHGFKDNFQRNANQLKVLLYERFDAVITQLVSQGRTFSGEQKMEDDKLNQLDAELDDIRKELDKIQNEE